MKLRTFCAVHVLPLAQRTLVCSVAAESISVNVMDKFCLLVVEVKFSRLPKQNACVDSWDSRKPLCKGVMPA